MGQGGRQQDSHELLRCLLGGIQAEDEAAAKRLHPNQIDENDEVRRALQLPISALFEGQLGSRMTCSHCHHTCTVLEPFLDLSLSIPPSVVSANAPPTSSQEKRFPRGRGALRMKGQQAAATAADVAAVPTSANAAAQPTAKHKKKDAQKARKLAEKERKKQRRSGQPSDSDPCPVQSAEDELPKPAEAAVGSGPALRIRPQAANKILAGDAEARDSPTAESLQDGGRPQSSPRCSLLATPLEAESPTAAALDAGLDFLLGFGSDELPVFLPQPPPPRPAAASQQTDCGPVAAGASEPAPAAAADATSAASDESCRTVTGSPPIGGQYSDEANTSPASSVAAVAENKKPANTSSSLDATEAATIKAMHASSPDASTAESPADEDGEEMAGLGDLFDDSSAFSESRVPAPDASDDCEDWSADSPAAHDEVPGEATLQACLAAYFGTEAVSWECPGEALARRASRETSRSLSITSTGDSVPISRRTVSFSGERPRVRVIPGSVEQRGTNLQQAMQGKQAFCRPLRYQGATLLVTAETDPLGRDRLNLSLVPQDEDTATAAILLSSLAGPSVSIDTIEDIDDEDEQRAVAAKAQLLINCGADMVRQHGLEGFAKMQDVQIKAKGSPVDRTWSVTGQLPSELGGGRWEYPAGPETPVTPQVAESPFGVNSSKATPRVPFQVALDAAAAELPANAGGEATQQAASLETMPAAAMSTPFASQPAARSVDASPADSSSAPRALRPPLPPSASSSSRLTGPSDCPAADGPPAACHQPSTGDGRCQPGQPCACSPADASPPAEASIVHDTASTPSGDGTLLPEAASGVGKPHSNGNAAHGQPDQHTDNGAAAASTPSGSETRQNSGRMGAQGSGEPTSLHTPPSALRGSLANVQRKADKGYLINRAPQLLTIHLKRFRQDARGRLVKVSGHIAFDLDLDMTSFCNPQGQDALGARYTLVGVVEHAGQQLASGHYWAYVQRGLRTPTSAAGSTPPVPPSASSPATGQQLNGMSDGWDDITADVLSSPVAGGASSGLQHPEVLSGNKGTNTGTAAVDTEFPNGSQHVGSSDTDSVTTCAAASPGSPAPSSTPQWYHASDMQVSKVSRERVLACEAYILLYMRVA